jgi:putative DNA primase/helicase
MARSLVEDISDHPLVQTEGKLRQVIRRMLDDCCDPNFVSAGRRGMTVKNGHVSVDPVTGLAALLAHSPDYRSRFALEFDFEQAADCPVFREGLELSMPDARSRDALQEYLGCAVFDVRLPGDNACSMAILWGPKNCGKSSVLLATAGLLPPDQVCALQPHQFSEPFMLAELRPKRLNVVTELDPAKPIGGARFKAIASREDVTDRAIREAAARFTPEAYHLYACNQLPQSVDRTTAFGRRMRAFRFPRSLTDDEINPDFRALIAAERPGYLNWLLDGAKRAIQRGKMAVPPENDELIARMQHGDDFVTGFVASCFERAEGAARLSTKCVFAALCRYAEGLGIHTAGWSTVTYGRRISELMQLLHGAEPPEKKGGTPHYDGIRLHEGA